MRRSFYPIQGETAVKTMARSKALANHQNDDRLQVAQLGSKRCRFFFLCLLLSSLVMAVTAQAQELPPNVSTIINDQASVLAAEPIPIFSAVSELAFNAGEVEAPGNVAREFRFKNDGDAPLEIKEVKSGCGCLVASYDPVIQPGSEGAISISMKIYPEWDGREVSRTTWVMTNDPRNPQIRLTTTAKAKSAAKVETD